MPLEWHKWGQQFAITGGGLYILGGLHGYAFYDDDGQLELSLDLNSQQWLCLGLALAGLIVGGVEWRRKELKAVTDFTDLVPLIVKGVLYAGLAIPAIDLVPMRFGGFCMVVAGLMMIVGQLNGESQVEEARPPRA